MEKKEKTTKIRNYQGGFTRDSLTDVEFDEILTIGLCQAKNGDSISVDEAFALLCHDIEEKRVAIRPNKEYNIP